MARTADACQVTGVLVAVGRMHANEVDTDVSLVGRLLAAQFPQWADLPIKRVPSAGTDNAIYRAGDDLVVRLPLIDWAIGQVDKEHEWLPRLAPLLPLDIPVPLAMGAPGEGYPWRWSVYRWLEGEEATTETIADMRQAAIDIAQFIVALRRIDTTDWPTPAPRNFGRGSTLATRDAATRKAIAAVSDMFDAEALTDAWETALRAPEWQGPTPWIHGDLKPGNLLAQQGRLSGVIDFGGLSVGDPAADMLIAWNFLSGETRDVFRATLLVDDATWARGRGCALSFGLIALPYYQITNPVLAEIARRTIAEVLADHKQGT